MVTALATTNWISLLVTVLVLLISYPLAYYLANTQGMRFTLVLFCIVMPYFTSIIVRTYSWMVLLGRNGIINQTLLNLGVIDQPLELLYTKTGVLIGMVYVLLPYMVLTLYATMKSIDPSLMRAARGLGASGFYAFTAHLLPAERARRHLRLADRLHPGDRLLHHAGPDGRADGRDDRDADRAFGRDSCSTGRARPSCRCCCSPRRWSCTQSTTASPTCVG